MNESINNLRRSLAATDAVWLPDTRLSAITTFRIGGPCLGIIDCPGPATFVRTLQAAWAHHIPTLILGEGSNVLAPDEGIDRLVIRPRAESLTTLETDPTQRTVTVFAGASLDLLAEYYAHHGYTGLEFAHGIPGTIGGAVSGNAGAFGQDISQCVAGVTVINPDGKDQQLPHDALGFSYRSSRFKSSPDVIVSVTLHYGDGDAGWLAQERERVRAVRHDKHPDYRTTPCAGSFFKNIISPDGTRTAAGKLLDEAGCKALRVGGASVFPKHANIIINDGQATAQDVRALADSMAQRVYERFGVDLTPEVRFV